MFDFKALYLAKTVAEACQLLAEHPEARIIAGGSDVLISSREGKLPDVELVSIYDLDELRGVSLEEDGSLRIGSLTSFSQLYADPLIKEHVPVLGEAANMVGGPQVRNIGTVGGNTCNGVTSADTGASFLAHDTVIELQSREGRRLVPMREFYLGAHKVDIRPGELQTALIIRPESYRGYYGYYFKYAMREAMDIATCACSVNVKLTADKRQFDDVRIAYGVAAAVPIRSPQAEAAARGSAVDRAQIAQIAKAGLTDIKPRSSWRATADFRTHISEELLKRCLTEAARRAGAEI